MTSELSAMIGGSFPLQAYRSPKDFQQLRKGHVAFSGSPRKHPFDPHRIILISDPYSVQACYYEFDSASIAYAEELPSLVNPEGESLSMARIWVKKGSLGIQSTPFVVADTRRDE